jgi:alkylhydroperoxidase family enzyme
MLDRLFRRLARGRIDGFERTFGYDATYMREVLEVSPRAFRAFAGIPKLSQHREGVPADVVYAAKLTTAAAEDCGPCAQLAVTMAEREGVPPQTLRDIVAGEVDRLPAGAALGVRFARAVLARSPELDDLRADVVRTWGRAALISLTFAIAATRVYPLVKYALGHGRACQRLRVAGVEVRPAGARARAMIA